MPVKQISFSNSRLTTFKRCRLRYHWQYVEKQGQTVLKSRALRRGTAAHAGMAAYYQGKPLKEAVAVAWEAYAPSDLKSLKYMLELDLILSRYFNWAKTNDLWNVVAVEQTVEVDYGPHKLMGIWDLLVKRTGKLYIVDHKFQKSHSFSNLEVDPQVTHYLALARLMGLKVEGLIYNIINLETGKTDKIAFREQTSRQDYFIKSYLDSLEPQIKEIKKAQRQKLPIYANWTKDCCWDCSFYRRCIDDPFEVQPKT